jgi:HPP family protein
MAAARREAASHDSADAIISPLVAAGITALPGLLALASGQVLLFPSLGPSAVMQAHSPEHRSSRFYNVVVSHLAGLAAADVCVLVFGLAHAPSIFQLHAVTAARVAAAVLAIALATAAEIVLRATHPPAASTTLLVALGSFRPTLHDGALIAIGVLIVATAGEAVRRARLRSRGTADPGR